MPSAVLLGSKPASVVALRMLQRRGWTVRAVVAAPHQASWLPGPCLADAAAAAGIPVWSRQDDLPDLKVDLVISYMFRHRVKPGTLAMGRYPVNFHAAPLPEFGGWAFYNVAILEAVREYGCTCHVMDAGFDTGPIVRVRRFPIDPGAETALSLEQKAQREMLALFEEVLVLAEERGALPSTPQDPARMRYLNADQFARLKEIPREASAAEADRIARAFWYPPYDMAYITTAGGARIEAIPDCVKPGVATCLHRNDLSDALAGFGFSPSAGGGDGSR